MRFIRPSRLCLQPFIRSLVTAFCLINLPVATLQANPEAVAAQALAAQEFNRLKLDQLVKQANQLRIAGDYTGAIEIWMRLKEYFESEFGDDHPATGNEPQQPCFFI